jgi:hypothetical protein
MDAPNEVWLWPNKWGQWREVGYVEGASIRFFNANLKCGECAHADFDDGEFTDEETVCMAGERAEVQKTTCACMAFLRKEKKR